MTHPLFTLTIDDTPAGRAYLRRVLEGDREARTSFRATMADMAEARVREMAATGLLGDEEAD